MAAAQFFSVFLSCEADQHVGSDLPVDENTTIRSSYEGHGRRSITWGDVVGVVLVCPCEDGVEVRP